MERPFGSLRRTRGPSVRLHPSQGWIKTIVLTNESVKIAQYFGLTGENLFLDTQLPKL